MPKVDKSQYSKAEWQRIKQQRKIQKHQSKIRSSVKTSSEYKTAFVLGNGVSRKPIDPQDIQKHGTIYGCNALYRSFAPDYLVAVDVKMVAEINKYGYQHNNEVWTNPNKSYKAMKNLNFFHPAKGWSSGPTALWLASQHGYSRIFILGFDYQGLEEGKRFNNLYADTFNYKKSRDPATFYGNWLRQTKTVIKDHPDIQYIRVIQADNFCPEELNKFDNFKTVYIEDFQKIFDLA